MKFCPKCGVQAKEGEAYCANCGAPLSQGNTPAQSQPGQRYAPPGQVYYTPEPEPAPGAYQAHQSLAPTARNAAKGGAKPGVIIAGISVGVLALVAVAVLLLSGGGNGGGGKTASFGGGLFGKKINDDTLPEVNYSYTAKEVTAEIDYTITDTIYPSLYGSMDSIVNLTATCEWGSQEVLVKAEVVGFTQPYEQKLTLSQQITKVYIKPAPLTGDLDLTTAKDAQLNLSVTELETGKTLVQDTKTIKLMSVYDFILWEDEFGEYNNDNVLAWLTPESEGILALRRNAIQWMDDYSGGSFNSLAGYQLSSIWGEEEKEFNVVMQVVGLQAAMSAMGMRYNMGSFSLSQGYNQRVLLPDDCLASGSGVCIETALIMASALQSANMHAMILFPPGHAQVAVETWKDSGEYFLIETTLLPFSGEDDEIDSLIIYLTADEWAQYLNDPWGDGSGGCYVVDCDMVTELGITSFNN